MANSFYEKNIKTTYLTATFLVSAYCVNKLNGLWAAQHSGHP